MGETLKLKPAIYYRKFKFVSDSKRLLHFKKLQNIFGKKIFCDFDFLWKEDEDEGKDKEEEEEETAAENLDDVLSPAFTTITSPSPSQIFLNTAHVVHSHLCLLNCLWHFYSVRFCFDEFSQLHTILWLRPKASLRNHLSRPEKNFFFSDTWKAKKKRPKKKNLFFDLPLLPVRIKDGDFSFFFFVPNSIYYHPPET